MFRQQVPSSVAGWSAGDPDADKRCTVMFAVTYWVGRRMVWIRDAPRNGRIATNRRGVAQP